MHRVAARPETLLCLQTFVFLKRTVQLKIRISILKNAENSPIKRLLDKNILKVVCQYHVNKDHFLLH